MKKDKFNLLTKTIEWLIYMFFYAIVFFVVSNFFDSFYIDIEHSGIYSFLAVVIIYILNKTIKPILFFLTIPITGITLGLFYPCINLFILKLTDWILGSHFQLNNIFIAFFIAILISIMNSLIDNIIVNPIIRRLRKS